MMHRRIFLLIFALVVAPFGAVSMALPATTLSCEKPDKSFQSFLPRFTDDLAFQRSRLSLPLVARSGDGVTAAATIELWSLEKIEALKNPLIYSHAERRKLNLSQSIDLVRQTPSVAEVWQAEKAESDAIKLQYWFRKRDGCWFLAEFDDWGE